MWEALYPKWQVRGHDLDTVKEPGIYARRWAWPLAYFMSRVVARPRGRRRGVHENRILTENRETRGSVDAAEGMGPNMSAARSAPSW